MKFKEIFLMTLSLQHDLEHFSILEEKSLLYQFLVELFCKENPVWHHVSI